MNYLCRKPKYPVCQQCGVANRSAHEAGTMHQHYSIIAEMIEVGGTDMEICRRVGLDPSKHRQRMYLIRKRLTIRPLSIQHKQPTMNN